MTSRSVILSRGCASSGWMSDEAGAALRSSFDDLFHLTCRRSWGGIRFAHCVPSGAGLRARRHPS